MSGVMLNCLPPDGRQVTHKAPVVRDANRSSRTAQGANRSPWAPGDVQAVAPACYQPEVASPLATVLGSRKMAVYHVCPKWATT